ncbi:hypothetical protein PanWU01x14_300250 [Parasponia andersonii]|uniref:Late embryogenesis abundant protein n=1 Tax=Parasponia andersonii TaxID=3476 RepID=A0A2P5AU54_PARAD|nr:hypothetical protein PanWU01x14_300250 [Parasponia andersonii]
MQLLAKRTLFGVSKLVFRAHAGYVQSASISLSRACFSTAYERAQGLGGRAERATIDHTTRNDVVYGENYGHRGRHDQNPDHRNIENESSGITGFVADKASQGAIGAIKMADSMGDLAKETMEMAWDSTKNATRNVQDTMVAAADENVVDTTEYRTIEDLKNSLGSQ